MTTSTLEAEIQAVVHGLSRQQQQQVLEFARQLVSHPVAAPAAAVVEWARGVDPADAEAMARAIEEEFPTLRRHGR